MTIQNELDIKKGHFTIDELKKANTLIHKIEDIFKYIGLHINSDKTEYMCLNKRKQDKHEKAMI